MQLLGDAQKLINTSDCSLCRQFAFGHSNVTISKNVHHQTAFITIGPRI